MVAICNSTQFLRPSPPFLRRTITVKSPSLASSSVKFCSPIFCVAGAGCESADKTRPFSSSRLCSSSCCNTISLYEVLGLPIGASIQEIKAAYRKLARVFHPDVASNDLKDSSADEFMKIHAAYSTLSDPEKRADYDRKLFRRIRSYYSRFRGISSGVGSGYTSRNWETDQCW